MRDLDETTLSYQMKAQYHKAPEGDWLDDYKKEKEQVSKESIALIFKELRELDDN